MVGRRGGGGKGGSGLVVRVWGGSTGWVNGAGLTTTASRSFMRFSFLF